MKSYEVHPQPRQSSNIAVVIIACPPIRSLWEIMKRQNTTYLEKRAASFIKFGQFKRYLLIRDNIPVKLKLDAQFFNESVSTIK